MQCYYQQGAEGVPLFVPIAKWQSSTLPKWIGPLYICHVWMPVISFLFHPSLSMFSTAFSLKHVLCHLLQVVLRCPAPISRCLWVIYCPWPAAHVHAQVWSLQIINGVLPKHWWTHNNATDGQSTPLSYSLIVWAFQRPSQRRRMSQMNTQQCCRQSEHIWLFATWQNEAIWSRIFVPRSVL